MVSPCEGCPLSWLRLLLHVAFSPCGMLHLCMVLPSAGSCSLCARTRVVCLYVCVCSDDYGDAGGASDDEGVDDEGEDGNDEQAMMRAMMGPLFPRIMLFACRHGQGGDARRGWDCHRGRRHGHGSAPARRCRSFRQRSTIEPAAAAAPAVPAAAPAGGGRRAARGHGGRHCVCHGRRGACAAVLCRRASMLWLRQGPCMRACVHTAAQC